MAKRFTDSEKYKKPFVRSLKGAYKLFWDYLCTDCDNSGIWIVDFEIAQIYLGSDMKVDRDEALACFNQDEYRVHVFDGGRKWFIPSFIAFQYNELSETNPAHKKIISTLGNLGFLINGKIDLEVLRATSAVPSKGTMVVDKVEGVVQERVEGVVKAHVRESAYYKIASGLIAYLNELAGRKYLVTNQLYLKHIVARLRDGYTETELREIIEYKVAEWKDSDMERNLVPDTLFNKEKCNKYRDQVQHAKQTGKTIHDIKPKNGKEKFNANLDQQLKERYDKRISASTGSGGFKF